MRIFSTWKLPDHVLSNLEDNGFDVVQNDTGDLLSHVSLRERCTGFDGIISLLNDRIDRGIMEQNSELKIVANVAVGYDNIDVQYAPEIDITVTNTPDILTAATADLTMALFLSVVRLTVAGDRFMRERKFTGWRPDLFVGMDLQGAVIGIFGMGKIGRAVAQRMNSFGCKILYHNRHRINRENESGAEYVSFEDLLTRSDAIIVLSPLTPETRNRFGNDEFEKMKDRAVLINVGRGPIVSEAALVKALKSGKLSGAGMDVYEKEPIVNEQLYGLENVVLLPHIGSAGKKTREDMFALAAENVIAVLSGKSPLTPVK